MKSYIIILIGFVASICSCYDDDSTLGKENMSQVIISTAYDTLTTYFGEELIVNGLNIEQSGEELPLTYEWAYGNLDISNGVIKPYPIKDTLHVVSTDPELRYVFRDLGTFGLRLKVDNGETTSFKYFVLQIDTEFAEGITILSRDDAGKGRISFMKTLTREEISNGQTSVFRTDIMEIANPNMELENVTDMVQNEGRLLISSGGNGRIYNMDSRTFDIETATSFTSKFPDINVVQFVGISAYSNMHVFSENGKAYVYETDNDEMLVLDAFENLDLDTGIPYKKPVFVNYTNSILYAPNSSKGITTSGSIYTDYDIVNACFINTYLYVFATYKDNPLHVYVTRTTSSLSKPSASYTVDYVSTKPICMDRNSMAVGTKKYNCIYYTYNNAIYRWDPGKHISTDPFINLPDNMEITTIAMDIEGGLLYVGVYEPNGTEKLKGSLYIYNADSGELVEIYNNVADKPIRVLYKERV